MKRHPAAVAALSCIATALCLLAPHTVSGDETDPRVSQDQCHGKPHWCVKVSNQTDTTVKVYVDGDPIWSMAPGEVDWFPFPDGGGDHEVNVCLLYVFSSDKCLAPDTVKVNSDYLLVVYPQQ